MNIKIYKLTDEPQLRTFPVAKFKNRPCIVVIVARSFASIMKPVNDAPVVDRSVTKKERLEIMTFFAFLCLLPMQ